MWGVGWSRLPSHPGLVTINYIYGMKKIAVFAGSFDPFTVGHLDIVARASSLFDELYMLLAVNASKKNLFDEADRAEMARKAVENIPNVKVDCFDGRFREACRCEVPGARHPGRSRCGIRTDGRLEQQGALSRNRDGVLVERPGTFGSEQLGGA